MGPRLCAARAARGRGETWNVFGVGRFTKLEYLILNHRCFPAFRRVRELVLISVLAAFRGGLARQPEVSPAEPQPEKGEAAGDERATRLTDFGTDQSPMMTGHSSKIRTKWSNATGRRSAQPPAKMSLRP